MQVDLSKEVYVPILRLAENTGADKKENKKKTVENELKFHQLFLKHKLICFSGSTDNYFMDERTIAILLRN
jgi:hypothetical protein